MPGQCLRSTFRDTSDMIATLGIAAIYAAFVLSLAAIVLYYRASNVDAPNLRPAHAANVGVLVATVVAMGALVYLLVTHQFQYFYVYNYTSTDLALRYLVAALWGGQEGSFLVWIFFTSLTAVGLMKWSPAVYRAPVLLFMMLSIACLLSMTLGLDVWGVKIGASPFRTLVQEMPNAPFLQANPGFVPADGRGLNDLLRSPWMVIHPPILFLGFAMMTVPFAFALAALWKRSYHDWIAPAMPWTLGANLCLFIAIFLGAYWAYVTLSFGGYWAWDPVENASFVPWLFGVAGIHTMLIQKKKAGPMRASFLFAIFAYILILYEAFLTRSGILGDASVHSFVDLGLYNQLLLFMVINAVAGLVLFAIRFKELPGSNEPSPVLSSDFLVFSGAITLFVAAMVILLGTSSPIIGRLFTETPTPPEISFYNNWSMPAAMIIAVLTVLGQVTWRRRVDSGETLAGILTWPTVVTSVVSVAAIIGGEVSNPVYMAYLFTAIFGVVGNGFILVDMLRRTPRLAGGALTHVGFAVMLVGFLFSSAYNTHMLDADTHNYNLAVEQGRVKDDQGFEVIQKAQMFKLDLNQPKEIDGGWLVTYLGMSISNIDRPGEQRYKIAFQRADDPDSRRFVMEPVVYPMLASSSPGNINWSVDPEVRAGLVRDIYMYVANSSHIEQESQRSQQPGSMLNVASSDTTGEPVRPKMSLKRGEAKEIGPYLIRFDAFESLAVEEMPDSAVVGVRALLTITDTTTGEEIQAKPSYAIIASGEERFSMSQPVMLDQWNLVVRFDEINPNTDQVTLSFRGDRLPLVTVDDWVLVVAENKPLISLVWLGTFLLMGGFSVSIMRRWSELRKKRKFHAETV